MGNSICADRTIHDLGKIPLLGVEKETNSLCGNQSPALIKERNSSGIGTLRFAQQESMWSGRSGWGAWDGMAVGNVPTFWDIEDVDSIYRLVSDLREKTRTAKATTF
jgi:hypothetical protein